MSELIPEKRRDKNGRLVTKHVRPAAARKQDAVLPVPTVSPESSDGLNATPHKTQLRTHFRFIPVNDLPATYKDVWSAMGMPNRLDMGGFHASDSEMYDVLSVTDRGTACALLEYGIRSSGDATRKLWALGMEGLLEDNSEVASGALSRRIMPESYIRQGTPGNTGSKYFLDYLEVGGFGLHETHPELHAAVLIGLIRASDVKTIGLATIRNADNWPVIKKTLVKLADGSVSYTAEEAKKVIEQNTNRTRYNTISDALLLADRYGAEFALEIPASVQVMEFSQHLQDEDTGVEKSRSVLRYYVQVQSHLPQATSPRLDHSFPDIIRFHDAGAGPEQVATGRITVNQIEAINTHGIAPSVAGGWL